MTYRIVAERGDRLEIVSEWEFEKNAYKFLKALVKQSRAVANPPVYRMLYQGYAYWGWTGDLKMVAEARKAALLRVATRRFNKVMSDYGRQCTDSLMRVARAIQGDNK